jgi:hypothetical protein
MSLLETVFEMLKVEVIFATYLHSVCKTFLLLLNTAVTEALKCLNKIFSRRIGV